MTHASRTAAAVLVVMLVGCVPADGSTPLVPYPEITRSTPASPPSVSPTPSAAMTPSPSPLVSRPSRSTTRPPEPSASLPEAYPVAASLLDDGAAVVVARLHEVSGLRPALKLDISSDEVILTVLTTDLSVQSYRWRDGVIDLAETDVQYLGQTIFWPTDFAITNVRRIFDVAALHGTSANGQVLQVVEYGPGRVFMSVTTSPETRTVFFRKDGTIFRSLSTSSVADIREGISDVVGGASKVNMVGFDSDRGFYAELPAAEDTTERRSRMANRPVFSSQRAGSSSLTPFDPALLDAAAIAQSIASRESDDGCSVEIDNRFNRVQPVVTYRCASKTFYSDLSGTDLTSQLG